MEKRPGKLFIIIGPSGVGKTTLMNTVLESWHIQNNLERVITYTSRQKRAGEEHAKDYYFIDQSEFKFLLERNYFMEHSCVYGTYYGSPCSIVERMKEGISFIMAVDINGALSIKKSLPGAVLVGIYVEEIGVLRHRLQLRLTEKEAEIEHRIALATSEMEFVTKNDALLYRILNKDFEKSVKNLKEIIKAELGI